MRKLQFVLAALAVICAVLIFTPLVFAQTEEQPQAESESVIATDNLEGMTVEEPKTVPSNFGFWWRGVKERVSIALTVNPVKKAEKQLKFAEERMNLAKVIVEKSTDPKIQAKAQTMIESAEKLMAKIEDKKDQLIVNKEERAQRLLKNIATHEVRKEKILDAIEAKLPAEKQEQFQVIREKVEQNSNRLLNAVSNANVPEAVKAHLQNVKDRIEEHAEVVKEFQAEKREILDKVKSGDEGAKEQLKLLNEDRKQVLEQVRIDFKEKSQVLRQEIKEDAVSGNVEAQKEVRILNRVEKAIQNVRERAKERAQKKLNSEPAVDATVAPVIQ